MTGGRAVILGPVGFNFAAGMTGGMAYVLDLNDRFLPMLNKDSVVGPGRSVRLTVRYQTN